MPKSAYPTSTDLSDFLTAAGFTTGTLDLGTAVTAGRLDFERRAGRVMLAPAGTVERFYDPPVGQEDLDFRADLAALTSVAYQPQGGASETWVHYTDFWLRPYNAADDSQPYLGMELRRRWAAPLPKELRRAIRVTGRWGYFTTIPDDAWLGMVQRAAALLCGQKGFGISGGLIRKAEAGVEQLWGDDPVRGAREAWNHAFETAVAGYRRWGV